MGADVSYVVTVYNKTAFLPLVVEGLRRQDGAFAREFVFVDDRSTDGSVEMLRALTADLPNTTIIEQTVNGGPARAINAGFAAATGRWIKALDGDDVLVPNATAVLLAAAQSAAAGLAYGQPVAYGQDAGYDELLSAVEGWRDGEPRGVTVFDDHLPESLGQSRMNPSCWLAERELVLRSGGADERVFIQDYSLELRMAAEGARFVRVANPIFLWLDEVSARLSGNERQILHDCNLAVANLFRDRSHLAGRYGNQAARRVLGRAWHWARRREGKGVGSGAFLRYLKARLGLWRVADLQASCRDFGGPIRRPSA
ncbi:MAG: glycosyltransferase family 2 protein [Solirubrobacterales bacterium]